MEFYYYRFLLPYLQKSVLDQLKLQHKDMGREIAASRERMRLLEGEFKRIMES